MARDNTVRQRSACPFPLLSWILMATAVTGSHAAGDVRITYNSEEDGTAVTKTFDLLVVACDPTLLADVFDGRTELEERAESALERYTISASLWDVMRSEADDAYSVRFWPEKLGDVDGQVYGFRDEPRARTGRTEPQTLVAVYQFANTSVSEEIIMEKLNDAMMPLDGAGDAPASYEYAALGLEAESSEMIDIQRQGDYFPHFSQEDLNAGLPWAILDAQGSYSTIYVSSFTSHENVNSIYEYGNLLSNTTQVQDAFQAARDASAHPKVAVIGAGPSGLLFASQQLKAAGFDNVTIFEKQDRWGGKTLTTFHDDPGQLGEQTIPVELGTCYMSAAYQAFWTMVETKYGMEKPVRLSYGENETSPRGIIDTLTGELVAYDSWILTGPNGTPISSEDLATALGTYAAAHYSLAGWNSIETTIPMPTSMPEDLPNMTFLEYLQALDLDVLQNIFTFANSVQGYGTLGDIPAYYGLIWMTPDTLLSQLDFAASASEQLAVDQAAENEGGEESDMGSRGLLGENTSAIRHSAKVVRDVRKSAARELRSTGNRPSLEQAKQLAMRSLERVLAGDDDAGGSGDEEEEETRIDGVGIVQEGWLTVWDRIVSQEGLRSKIKLGVDITKIERKGLAQRM